MFKFLTNLILNGGVFPLNDDTNELLGELFEDGVGGLF